MKTKSIKEKISNFFMQNPTAKLRVRQIERALKLPLPSVIRYTKELEKKGILKSNNLAEIRFYAADRASKIFLLEKKIFNIRAIFESGLIDYMIQEYSNPTIVLFGSYSKGEDIESSDVDIYVETQKKYDFNLQKFEKILQRKIQLFNYPNIKKITNLQLLNNIINGIVLNGFLEVF